ncbi:hypothetical protein NDU88_002183 [Pleurodeles waltl]|uniref:Uncharacterized protein n=1 Tax=Pleurodeles waltl TaxID=8319 RepID=A0AAV7Q5W4_PLEWA|nr:hypothetical protein NDU88_002183 [Pleurodeles waltl]
MAMDCPPSTVNPSEDDERESGASITTAPPEDLDCADAAENLAELSEADDLDMDPPKEEPPEENLDCDSSIDEMPEDLDIDTDELADCETDIEAPPAEDSSELSNDKRPLQ